MTYRLEAMTLAIEAARIRGIAADAGALVEEAKKIEAYLKGGDGARPKSISDEICHAWARQLEGMADASTYLGQRQSLRELAAAIREGRA